MELIRMLMRRIRDQGKLSEDTNMKSLVKFGTGFLSREFTFETYINKTTTVKPTVQCLTFREQLQTKLTKIYQDSIQIVTAHGLLTYQVLAMFLTCGD
eukprot:snap_masked-scaffold_32-processed-gene-1.18-mRNA-1 protein AED:1.00 eAED:1.00 QI:0/-1/0/0/-1/1/1/0/97